MVWCRTLPSVAAGPRLRFATEVHRAVALIAPFGLPTLGRVRGEVAGKPLGPFYRRRPLTLTRITQRRVAVSHLVPFQQRVLLYLAIDEIAQFEVRELQHFDRLLLLRRHHQALRLSQSKPLSKTGPVHIPLRSE